MKKWIKWIWPEILSDLVTVTFMLLILMIYFVVIKDYCHSKVGITIIPTDTINAPATIINI